jgi:DUF1680 family protein
MSRCAVSMSKWPVSRQDVRLSKSIFLDRFRLNRSYVMSLTDENLLQNFTLEAALSGWVTYNNQFGKPNPQEHRHYGWESPTCALRGHFLGHWLSGAAMIWASTGDEEVRLKVSRIIDVLERCQERNGGGWLGSFPEKYFRLLAEGKPPWAPHYVTHKTFMGLIDVWSLMGNEKALELADRFADWFVAWSRDFGRGQMERILAVETGGMLEVWADLYAATQDSKYLGLIDKYTHYRLFDPLIEGKDVLTNRHANTTIPEAAGAARVYEVTGDEWYRRVAEEFWRCAVTNRGTFCTGGQNTCEWWNPPFEFAARRNEYTQEHCTVYNMVRLADYLFRWSGDASYLDYIERNIYNGILAQQNPETGMVSYWLPLHAGASKRWGHPTRDFWCCHGTLVQAHGMYSALTYYHDSDGFVMAQYIPSQMNCEWKGTGVRISQAFDERVGRVNLTDDTNSLDGPIRRPDSWTVNIDVLCESPTRFVLRLRKPEWVSGPPVVTVNGERVDVPPDSSGFVQLDKVWETDRVVIELPKTLRAEPIPDEPEAVAFLDGPIVLAGLSDREVTLYGDKDNPRGFMAPDDEQNFKKWHLAYRTVKQPWSIRFIPLYEVVDEVYTVYFPVQQTVSRVR